MPRIAVDEVEPDAAPPANKPTEVLPEKPVNIPPANQPVSGQTSILTDKELEDKSTTSILAAFEAFPKNITFADEGDDENIVLLLRAHIVTMVPWILIALGAILLPLILLPIIGAVGLPIGGGSVLAFILFWYLGIFTYAFINFLYWYFNVYIVTNERVVDIDWYSILYRKVSSAQISKIQDVSASHGGVFSSVFDYGNVQIQTAGEELNFEFTAVPHPQLVAKKIQELMHEEELEWEHNPT